MPVRGNRATIGNSKDRPEAVLAVTRELLTEVLEVNPELRSEDLASVIFTTKGDLKYAYPGWVAGELGWNAVPLFCGQDLPLPDGLPHNMRI